MTMGSYSPSSLTTSSSNVYPATTSMITSTTIGGGGGGAVGVSGGYPSKSQDISFDPSISTSNHYNQQHHQQQYTTNVSYFIPAVQPQPQPSSYHQYRQFSGEAILTAGYTPTHAGINNNETISSHSSVYYPNRSRSFSASYSPPNVHVINYPSYTLRPPTQHTFIRHHSANNLSNSGDSYSNDFNIIEQYEARIN